MDVAALATGIVAYLIPFLPYLAKAGDKAFEEAGKQLGTGVSEKFKSLWGKLMSKAESKPAAKEALSDVEKTPEDEDAQAALRLQLKKLFTEDENFAQEIALLWEDLLRDENSSKANIDRSISVGNNATRSIMITGDRNKVER